MSENPNSLENLGEADQRLTEWDDLKNADSPAKDEIDVKAIMDSVPVTEIDLPDDITSETANAYIATNDEVYKSLFEHLSQEILTAQGNGASPEIVKSRFNTRNILMEVHFANQFDVENGKPETPLVDALERRKAVYDRMSDQYRTFGDAEHAKEQADLSASTTELIRDASTVKKNLEGQKDPNSSYNQIASQFKGSTPSASQPATNNAAMFK